MAAGDMSQAEFVRDPATNRIVGFKYYGEIVQLSPADQLLSEAEVMALRSMLINGSSSVAFTEVGSGASAQTIQSKARQIISAAGYTGFDGTGTTNSRAAILAAAIALGAAGGYVYIPPGTKPLIDDNLTLPVNTSLKGAHEFVGSPGNNASAPYADLGGIRLNSAATITLSSGCGISGCLVYRKGMTFPAADSSAFAGTAITVASGADDTSLSRSMVIGFNKAYYSSGAQRCRVENVYFDCINGIDITNCLDVPYVTNCHGWPFASIAAGGSHTAIERTGSAYNIHDSVDGAKLTNCFSYGYATGIKIDNANSTTVLGGWSDNTYSGAPLNTGSIGCRVTGTSTETRLIGYQASAQAQAGIYIATVDSVLTQISSATIWGGGAHGILTDSGSVNVNASSIRGFSSGFTATTSIGVLRIGGGTWITGCSTPITLTVSTNKLILGEVYSDLPIGNVLVGANSAVESLASAGTVNLPINGKSFLITGTTSFGSLNGGWKDREITLIFAGALSVFSSTGATSAMRLNGGSTFNTTANATLTLVHTGGQWYEKGRAA